MKYDDRKTGRISFPLGGIGTGSIGLCGNGALRDWEIFNRPNKDSYNGFTHFAVRAENGRKVIDARVLQGDAMPPYDTAFYGTPRESLAGLPHFRKASFEGVYPEAKMRFTDPSFPGKTSLKAFNPFIPHNSRDSSLPAAFFEIEIENTTSQKLHYTVVGSLANPVFGTQRHVASQESGISLIQLASDGAPNGRPPVNVAARGDLCLATDAVDVSWQEFWFNGGWFDSLEVYWKDLLAGGRFTNRSCPPAHAMGLPPGYGLVKVNHALLATHFDVEAGKKARVRFVLSWNFPIHEKYWSDAGENGHRDGSQKGSRPQWTNWYATQWKDSRASALYSLQHWDRLAEKTHKFSTLLSSSTLPAAAIDAVSANLSILKSPTVLRLTDGTFWAWEGCMENEGSCSGTCTHVWNYGQSLPFLFPELERSVREADYRFNQQANGGMPFRLPLPLGNRHSGGRSAADGLFSNVLAVYRDWKLTGDAAWLKAIWPAVKKSIAFAWEESNSDGWDPDRSGVLHGRQHHTLDMELFGPNSWLSGLYLAALRAGAEMAETLGDKSLARDYLEIFERGANWMEENLFNGEYYQQKIDLANKAIVDPFEAANLYWNDEHGEIKYQIGNGCAIDQVLGQWHADLYGLGEIFADRNVTKALKAVYRHNFKKSLRDACNPCRIYSVNDEGGAVMCVWPKGHSRPAIPLTYAQETMHGFEYAVASHMIARGLVPQGMDLVKSVRDRYDGEKRNPWGEMECGYNYGRSTASYALLLAFSGFSFDMTAGVLGFHPAEKRSAYQFFWSTGTAWGRVALSSMKAVLEIEEGALTLKRLELPMLRQAKRFAISVEGQSVVAFRQGTSYQLETPLLIKSGQKLQVRVN